MSADANELLAAVIIVIAWLAIAVALRRPDRVNVRRPSPDNRVTFGFPSVDGPINTMPKRMPRVTLDQL